MGETNECKETCSCKSPINHYLVLLGGFLRIVSIVLGVMFTAEGAANPEKSKELTENVIEVLERIADTLVE